MRIQSNQSTSVIPDLYCVSLIFCMPYCLCFSIPPWGGGGVDSVIDLKGGKAEEVVDVKLGYAHPQ